MKDNENTAMTEKLEKGCYVLSLSGRDSGRIHVVLCCGEDEYAYIADGRCRTVSKPKKKKAQTSAADRITALSGRFYQIRL